MQGQTITEQNNRHSEGFSEMDTLQMLKLINREDKTVAEAVEKELPYIAKAADAAAERLSKGGRMFYFGAGTSGRLGIIDAGELPCTYGVDVFMVQAVIAGGPGAVYDASMGDEDNFEAGVQEIARRNISSGDVVVGIAASGRTPYVLGAVEAGKESGALTIGICNTPQSPLTICAEIAIAAETGPEVIEGSTRMKAGTAQKMILNMLSTVLMTKLGYVYKNYMVRMVPNNVKLFERAIHITKMCTGATAETCKNALDASDWKIDAAIVMILYQIDFPEGVKLLSEHGNAIGRLIKHMDSSSH